MAGRTATTTSHAWLGALHAKLLRARASLQLRNYSFLGGASWSWMASLAILAAFLCGAAAFPTAVAFFLPLVASTSACCAAAHLFAESESERDAAKEVVLVRGEGNAAEAGSLQVFGDANASVYGDRRGVQVGCFLRRSARRGVDEDGEEVVFAGRLLVPPAAAAAGDDHAGGALDHEEELLALHVDSLAEGVWNSYFGGWSAWNHYTRDG